MSHGRAQLSRGDGEEQARWLPENVRADLPRSVESTAVISIPRLLVTSAFACAAVAPSVAAAQAPTAEHQKLEAIVGVWTFEGETRAVPELGMTDAGKVTYRHVNTMANGGFFLETRRTGTTSRGPITELFVYSYSPATRLYRQDAYDSRGRVRTFTGTIDGRTWTFKGVNLSAAGERTEERFTLVYSADMATATVRSEHSKDGVTWFERLTGTYSKAK